MATAKKIAQLVSDISKAKGETPDTGQISEAVASFESRINFALGNFDAVVTDYANGKPIDTEAGVAVHSATRAVVRELDAARHVTGGPSTVGYYGTDREALVPLAEAVTALDLSQTVDTAKGLFQQALASAGTLKMWTTLADDAKALVTAAKASQANAQTLIDQVSKAASRPGKSVRDEAEVLARYQAMAADFALA